MDVPVKVLQAISLLNKAGFEAYLVGGCVRDAVMGIPPHDYDLTTSATPEEMQQVFASFRTIETGLKHGTLTVLMDEYPLEITTFRLDGEYLDNRHPKDVTFTRDLKNDLSRRDFTVNAMAWHPEKGLVDLFGGQADCAKGIIRCVGDAATRFQEDALRILRALRFAARLRFTIEEHTAAAILEMQSLLHRISAERIAAELNGLLLAEGAEGILQKFSETVFTVLPEMNQPSWLISLSALSHAPRELSVRWAVLLHPLGEETANQVMHRLKAANALRNSVCALVRHHTLPLSEKAMQYALMQVGDDMIFPLISLQEALQAAGSRPFDAPSLRAAARQLLESNACFTLATLAVNGSDLSAIGLQGPAIGRTLHALLEQVAKGETENNKESLLALAKQAMEKLPDA